MINLRNEIYDKNNNLKYRIIICLGDFAYFAVRAVLNQYEGKEKHKYGTRSKYGIEIIGKHFKRNSQLNINKEVYILSVLHNIANGIGDLYNLRKFIPEEKRIEYISYSCYIGECLGNILINDIIKRYEYKDYLKSK